MTNAIEITQMNPNDVIYIQSRAEMNTSLIDEYAAMMAGGVVFDPADGVQDTDGQVIIWDGAHRTEAARKTGQPLPLRLTAGSDSDAQWLALSANQKHGLRRSRADKQQVVKLALLHPNGVRLSNREIARHCGVDHKTVGHLRSELETSGEIPRITERTVTRNGVSYQIETEPLKQRAGSASQQIEKPVSNVEERNYPASLTFTGSHNPHYLTATIAPVTIPAEAHHPHNHHYTLEEDQPFPCPQCHQQRVRGVNGSRRWCINCGATWPTAATFLNDVTAGQPQQPDKLRVELGRRFTELLFRLPPDQLGQLENQLLDLEQRFMVSQPTPARN